MSQGQALHLQHKQLVVFSTFSTPQPWNPACLCILVIARTQTVGVTGRVKKKKNVYREPMGERHDHSDLGESKKLSLIRLLDLEEKNLKDILPVGNLELLKVFL